MNYIKELQLRVKTLEMREAAVERKVNDLIVYFSTNPKFNWPDDYVRTPELVSQLRDIQRFLQWDEIMEATDVEAA
jgi:hypothetical protein